MQQASHVQVVNKNLYSQDGSGKAVPHGVLDHRMVNLKIVQRSIIPYIHFGYTVCELILSDLCFFFFNVPWNYFTLNVDAVFKHNHFCC